MRTDRFLLRTLRLCSMTTGAACLTFAVAQGDTLPVNFTVEYQHVDGAAGNRDVWSRSMDASYARRLSSDIQLSSQFRLNYLTTVGRPDKTLNPYGDLRLLAPTFGLISSYRPTAATNQFGVTTRQREGQVTAFLARPHLPRLDVQWTQRTGRPGDVPLTTTSTTRTGHLDWVLGPLELRGGVGDVLQEIATTQVGRVRQGDWSGGATYRRARSNWSFTANTDFNGGFRQAQLAPRQTTFGGGGDLNFSQKLSSRLDWNAQYQLHVAHAGDGTQQRLASHEGSANGTYRLSRATQFMLGLGVRPVNAINGGLNTLGYAFASATTQGRVRSGWKGLASVSEAVNRDPAGLWFGTTALRASSALTLLRGLQLTVDGTATANGDTAVHDSRYGTQTQLGVTANPLRPWTVTASVRGYRTGPSFTTAAAHSTGRSLDVRWQPSARFDARGSLTENGAFPLGKPRLSTHLFALRLSPSSRLQVDAQVSSSNSTQTTANAGHLPGLETWSGHLLAMLGRRYNLRIGGAIVDPGKSTRSRQADVAITGRLGGGS